MSLNMGLQVQVYVCVVSCRYVGLYMSVCICMQEQEYVCMVVGCVYAQVCVCTDICGKYMNKCVCVHACIQVHTVTAPRSGPMYVTAGPTPGGAGRNE